MYVSVETDVFLLFVMTVKQPFLHNKKKGRFAFERLNDSSVSTKNTSNGGCLLICSVISSHGHEGDRIIIKLQGVLRVLFAQWKQPCGSHFPLRHRRMRPSQASLHFGLRSFLSRQRSSRQQSSRQQSSRPIR